MCDRVGVLYAGRLVEEGETAQVLQRPAPPVHGRAAPLHPARRRRARITAGSTPSPASCRTSASSFPGCVFAAAARSRRTICRSEEPPLLRARRRAHQPLPLPRAGAGAAARAGGRSRAAADRPRELEPLLRVRRPRQGVQAARARHPRADGVSAAIWPGETLGLVGESGSGKTTLARTLLGIVGPTSGAVTLDGRSCSRRGSRSARADDMRALQIVFQNPDSRAQPAPLGPADPAALAEASSPASRGAAAEQRMLELMQLGSPRRALREREAGPALRRAQAAARDRACLRRRTAARRLRRADVGARRLGAGSDPQPARRAAGAAAGLVPLHLARPRRRPLRLRPDRRPLPRPADGARAGRTSSSTGPHHPYTEALLSAVPTIDGGGRERIRLEGEIPSAADPPSGCVFHTRCPRRSAPICDERSRRSSRSRADHLMRCHIPLEELRRCSAPGCAGRETVARVKIRAAVLEQTGGAASRCRSSSSRRRGRGEVLVRLGASGVCHSDFNAIDGTVGDPLPRRARPRGRGRRRGGRAGRDARRRRRPRRALVGAVLRRVRRVPARRCRSCARRPGRRWARAG